MTTQPEEPTKTKPKQSPMTFLGLTVNNPNTPKYLLYGVASLWALNGFILYWLDEQKRGTFGDMFGTINALFSGLAFAGIIYSILLQSEELKAQQKELRLTRKEFKLTREEIRIQNATLKQERFEDTFFRMLSVFNEIVSAIRVKGSTIDGRVSFRLLHKLFMDSIDLLKKDAHERTAGMETFLLFPTDRYKRIDLNTEGYLKAYTLFFSANEENLSHYFRTLYTLLSFVDDAEGLNHTEKYSYTRIVRAQLSYYELGLLFYNCLSRHGVEKHKPLLERYSMLKNLSGKLVHNKEHKELYHPSAFGLF